MKGYRKLAPGEVIREGDEVFTELNVWVDTPDHVIGEVECSWDVRRKARNDGTPPGWRHADRGEISKHGIFCTDPWELTEIEPMEARYDDTEHLVMPYPEDPRLKKEAYMFDKEDFFKSLDDL